MTIVRTVSFCDPGVIGEIIRLFPEQDQEVASKYFEDGMLADIELTVYAKDGIPHIAVARFVKPGK